MRLSWLLASLLVSIITLLAANLLLSPDNAAGYRALEAHHRRLTENLEELRLRRQQLIAQADLLSRSGESVRLEARRLQLYEEGEQVIRIEGYLPDPDPLSPGRIIRGRPVADDRSGLVRILALTSGLIALTAFALFDRAPSPGHGSVMRRTSR